MPRNIHAQFGRRTVLRALPATIMSAFVPAWVLDGSLKLPKLVTGSRTTDPNFRAKRINPNVAVGGVEAVNAQRLIVRNAEGLHVVIMNGRTAIDKVLGDPAHLRLIDHDLGRVHVGDTVWVRGVRDTGGELSAQYIIVNWILGWAGIAVDYGHANGRTWMRRAQSGRRLDGPQSRKLRERGQQHPGRSILPLPYAQWLVAQVRPGHGGGHGTRPVSGISGDARRRQIAGYHRCRAGLANAAAWIFGVDPAHEP